MVTSSLDAVLACIGHIDRRIERSVLGGMFVVEVGSRLVPWRLTSDCLGKEIAIILGGEVWTMHEIQNRIKDGNVQITCCAAGAAKYLLEQLRADQKPNERSLTWPSQSLIVPEMGLASLGYFT